ncbi:sodium/potassium/calcium exchanger Nckx30C-like isoform X2 [Parasteatoda tepidariorum]|uniref:sodium/potassium/calcium exchanger Nckx30C-like isoform X2 n=1 Tax=Parasteatoda tepidariorum TaxID=114398 RepID=UPI00077FA2CC|nr:sodium/potassium/calcium exchanger 2-like [Parasteatoda tepidariorum]XP_042895908.1 sodium/potassium/calcium exchanger 2-like [Parasteatoda tepidariorum]
MFHIRTRPYRQRWRDPRLVLLSVFFVILYFLYMENHKKGSCYHNPSSLKISEPITVIDVFKHSPRQLLSKYENSSTNSTNDDHPQAQFPRDLFTLQQRKHGAVVLHCFGLVYMFVALAIVCDEFFVPALDVITVKLDISEDVAGATFMAAGGSAPELFTSVIGVFISYDDVGIGTIVGSAVFNILFVISMCAIFSKTVLSLTWWPLFRDVTFYSISLIVLILCFKDNVIHWYEASTLLTCYAAYVIFMKFNEPTEKAVRKLLDRNKFTRVGSKDHLMKKRRASTPILHAGSKFRHGLLQLMIHSIDPLHDGKLDEKASQLHAIASLRVLLDAAKANGGYPSGVNVPGAGGCCSSCASCNQCVTCPTCQRPMIRPAQVQVDNPVTRNSYIVTASEGPVLYPPPTIAAVASTTGAKRQIAPQGQDPLSSVQSLQSASMRNTLVNGSANEHADRMEETSFCSSNRSPVKTNPVISTIMSDNPAVTIIQPGVTPNPASGDPQEIVAALQSKPEPEIEVDEPLDISWPKDNRKRFTYLLMAPIIFPLWLTLPDVRRDEKKKWFFITFIGSIVWIAIFSYLMVWWATVVGQTIGIPNEVMGLTFLAAGTSIPDLITSVLVARKGFGDMAVSSSIGSNIFDVTVGLPVPWLLSALAFGPVKVSSTGMACSIIILFAMLIFVIVSIAIFKWKMNIGLALVMFLLYFAFVAMSLVLEYEIVDCAAIMSYVSD